MEQTSHRSEMSLPQYTVYVMSRKERLFALCAGVSVMAGIGCLFYQHWLAMMVLAVVGTCYPRIRRVTLLERKRSQLTQQFKQALYSISSSLSAGRSMENAFREARHDLKLLYPGTEVDVIRELHIISMRMENGEPIEQAIMDFSRRAEQDDISNFADVFVTCKRTGGDLIEVVRRTSSVIGEKMDIMQEIEVLIAQKKLEMKAMIAAPFLFLAFLNLTSPDFMAALYEGVGRVIATAALALLMLGAWLIQKMMNIRV
ncbi:type II secretion system F family protein [Paenibacillus profundus]|uniref:Type II secretion system F family protein n=1 Tax=Paenibacillus profundus TaxID=1173085 RepID=A0ABS8YA76_9BACL|nr:type II secretion system F family protein [Paenibacillus profundus]MCE5168813.1 type II secretion system F family protein [Paenibacillus profundus]